MGWFEARSFEAETFGIRSRRWDRQVIGVGIRPVRTEVARSRRREEPFMLSFLGRRVRLCDGLTRREVLRVGGLGFSGLIWSDLLRAAAAAGTPARSDVRPGEGVHPGLQLRRAVAPRPLGPEARRPQGNPGRIRPDLDPGPGDLGQRASPPPRRRRGPLRDPPIGQPRRQRSRGRHLPGPDGIPPPAVPAAGGRAARPAPWTCPPWGR